MYDLTGFQRDLLYVIAGDDEPHGLAIKEEIENYYEKEIHHGRLYPNLDDVVEKGLVEKGSADRRTNYYTITARGRRELEARRGVGRSVRRRIALGVACLARPLKTASERFTPHLPHGLGQLVLLWMFVLEDRHEIVLGNFVLSHPRTVRLTDGSSIRRSYSS